MYIWEFTQTHRANSRRNWKTDLSGRLLSIRSQSQTQLSDWTTTITQQINQIIQLKNGQRNWMRFFSKDIEMADRFKKWCLVSLIIQFSSVQFSSAAQSCLTFCNPKNRSTPGLPVHHQLPEFAQIYAHQVGDAIQPSHPLSSPSPPASNPAQHRVFSNESTLCMRWPKYWSFSFSISPCNDHSGLISFRMD